jgi:membrane protease YdiL (CAAX protease family)
MVIATVGIMIPLMMTGLIIIDVYTMYVYIDPLAMIIMTTTEIAFVIPPMYYVRKHGLPRSAVGIKNMVSPVDAVLGLAVGAVMLASNIGISWLMDNASGSPPTGVEGILVARNWPEMIVWILVMTVFVGFTEELLFRGFMQRRMDMYFRGRGTKYFKVVSLVVSSFIFGAIHFDLIGLPTRFLLGMFLGYLAQERQYNLLGPSIAHGVNNAAVVFLSSLPFLLPGF